MRQRLDFLLERANHGSMWRLAIRFGEAMRDVFLPAMAHPYQLGEALRLMADHFDPPKQTHYLDAFDERDACDAWAGLPIEFFNPGPDFGEPDQLRFASFEFPVYVGDLAPGTKVMINPRPGEILGA